MTDIDGLAGVLIYTSRERFPELEVFYLETLRLTPRSRRPGFVNFEWGGQRLTLAVHSEVDGPARDPKRIMVNLTVSDIDGVAALLAERGVVFVREPEPESWGGRIATLADPDGNLIQLLELPGRST